MKPTPLSSIGIDPTGIDPTGVEKNDWAAGLLIGQIEIVPGGVCRNAGNLRSALQTREVDVVEILVAADRDVADDERV